MTGAVVTTAGPWAALAATPALQRVLRHRRAVSVVVLVVWLAQWALSEGTDWHYVTSGGRLLLGEEAVDGLRSTAAGGTGLHLYAVHPDIQMGPLTLLLGRLLLMCGDLSWPAAVVLQLAMGAHIARALLGVLPAPVDDAARLARFAALGIAAFAWTDLTLRWGHLDDALVLWAAVIAATAVHRHRLWPAATAMVIACAAKPVGLVLLPLLLVRPGRGRVPAAVAAAGIGAVWLPFVAADAATLSAGSAQIPVLAGSVLDLFLPTGAAAPSWVRPAQLVLALLAGAVLCRGRWHLLPLAAFSVRTVLDPGAYSYYTAYLVIGWLVADAVGERQRMRAGPVLAVVASLTLAPYVLTGSSAVAGLRLAACALVVGAVWPRGPGRPRMRTTAGLVRLRFRAS